MHETPQSPNGTTVDSAGVDRDTWMRDVGALLALPAMWLDSTPADIVDGLLGVLFGILQLDGAYARVEGADGSRRLESWRPAGARVPVELMLADTGASPEPTGLRTLSFEVPALGEVQVARLSVTLPWAVGLVLMSSTRASFPTATEAHLIRVAVGQAAVAIRSADRLVGERQGRIAAEATVARQNEVLRTLVDGIEPSLAAISDQVKKASGLVVASDSTAAVAGEVPGVAVRAHPATSLTRREKEVLGLLAQGLSNGEIASLVWLSARTVERHLTSLYRKIGVSRRSEATAYAFRHGSA